MDAFVLVLECTQVGLEASRQVFMLELTVFVLFEVCLREDVGGAMIPLACKRPGQLDTEVLPGRAFTLSIFEPCNIRFRWETERRLLVFPF